MRTYTRLLILLLALAFSGRVSAAALGGAGTAPTPAAHHHGQQGCHEPSAPERMPCDTTAPDCPLMVGCFPVGPVAIVMLVESEMPDRALPFPPRHTQEAQFAPVPDSPPPRA